jgi:methyl acetate hydrolase
MPTLDRRQFLASGAAGALAPAKLTSAIDDTLRSGIARHKIPAVVAMAASGKQTLYQGAFGIRDASGVPVAADSIFAIASMTKAVTTVAALQLVEQGKVTLDESVSKHLPALADLEVLDGFDADGKPMLRPAKTPVTLRHLLTHTGGFCYDTWDEQMFRYASLKPPASTKPGPLMFEPGARWQYGQGVDWAGRLVEAVSGLTLEDYFQQKICQPLGMTDTSFMLPEAKFPRLVGMYARKENSPLEPIERKLPAPPKSFNGGGGLYSTAADYVRFMQMILNRGAGPNRQRVLKAATVRSMARSQIGSLAAGKMRSFKPLVSADVDIQPGHPEQWGLGFLINPAPYAGGRAAGSLAWAGLFNTFYWIDPKRDRCGVILMQFLPFVDKEAVGLLDEFERSVYQHV